MKIVIWIALSAVIIIGLFYGLSLFIYNEKQATPISEQTVSELLETKNKPLVIDVTPVEHASFGLQFGEVTIYVDPTDASGFEGQRDADIILVTDIHGDHLNVDALTQLVTEKTTLIVPQAVADLLSEPLKSKAVVLQNDQDTTVLDLSIKAVPMYNVPETADSRHTKGRGNGYIITGGTDTKVYIAGDTGPTDEMKALTDIDVAFIPMNLPYTMSVEDAAAAVLAFKPTQVYPYHYRTPDGLSDIASFKEMVIEANPAITVTLLDWYQKE
jgi:L-ascorbate metabolism protein UlaG (beta-lactamase superfamily)